MGASKTAQKQATRQRLYGALMELWANQPLAEVSVVELADRAGVSRMAFYRNCGTKEQVVEFYLDDLFGQYLQEMRAMTDLSVRSFTYRFFLNFEEHASLIAYLRRDGLEALLLRKFDQYLRQIVAQQLHHLRASTLEEGYLLDFVAGGLFKTLMAWSDEGMERPVAEVARKTSQLILRITGGEAVAAP